MNQMHFLISYGTSGGTPAQIADVNNQIAGVLSAYSHHRALGNTYIIRVSGTADWETILKLLQKRAQTAPIPLNFIMTPLMQPSSVYNGWMPKAAWEQINKLTQW